MSKMIPLACLLAFSAPVAAQSITAGDLNSRSTIYSAEGRRIGTVEKVVRGASGELLAVKVIYRDSFVTIPVDSLSKSDKGFTSSLSAEAIRKL